MMNLRRDFPRGSNERKRRHALAPRIPPWTPLTMEDVARTVLTDAAARRIFDAIKKRERKNARRLAVSR